MYKGNIVSDWGLFERMGGIDNPNAMHLVRGALNNFLKLPTTAPFKIAAQAFSSTGDITAARATLVQAFQTQAYATAGDFPASVLEVLDKYHRTLYFDRAWEEIFKPIDLRSSKRDSFDILDVISGLAFTVTPEGEKAHIYKMSGAKETVRLEMYSGGLGWSRRLFMNEEYWTIEDNAIEFQNKAIESKAQDHYDLIEATPTTYDLAWQAVTGAVPTTNENYVPIRDINTINKACENILIRLQDLGMSVSPNSQFKILSPIQNIGRLKRAIGMVQQPYAGSTIQLNYTVSPSYTLMFTNTSDYYVILPKNKIQTANRMDLTVFSDFDIESFTDIAVGWQWYGGAIGEDRQISRCKTE